MYRRRFNQVVADWYRSFLTIYLCSVVSANSSKQHAGCIRDAEASNARRYGKSDVEQSHPPACSGCISLAQQRRLRQTCLVRSGELGNAKRLGSFSSVVYQDMLAKSDKQVSSKQSVQIFDEQRNCLTRAKSKAIRLHSKPSRVFCLIISTAGKHLRCHDTGVFSFMWSSARGPLRFVWHQPARLGDG